jgi:type IV pilus assembly protein PilO
MSLKDFKLENLPRSAQLMIFAGLMLALMAVFYFLYLGEWIKERDALQAEVQQLQAAVAQSAAVESQLNRFKKELAQLEERLTVLRAILPAAKETPTVLRSVQDMASSSNLKISKFTPQPIVPRAFYSDWPIQMQVEGSYDALGRFFEKVSGATRIINVGNISIKGIDGSTDFNRTLTATCTATTFVFREDQVVGANSAAIKAEKP